MAPCRRGLLAAFVLFVAVGPCIELADAKTSVIWSRKRKLADCEPPHVFCSNQHLAGRKPCCATIEDLCAGGVACPVSGICPDNTPCVAGPTFPRPNIILF